MKSLPGKRALIVLLAILAVALMTAPAMAALTSPVIITTQVNGQDTSSSAAFTFGDGTVTVNLDNLLVGINNVGQAISDFGFVLSGTTSTATMTDSSGLERTVLGDLSFQDGGSVATGWSLTSGFDFSLLDKTYASYEGTSGTGYYLNVLGTPTGPSHLIIGPESASGDYDNANGSIAGNPPHNPFLYGASFTFDIAGVTAATTVDYVLFSYGTTPSSVGAVPIPPSVLLLGTGLLGLVGLPALRRRIRRED